MSATGRHKAAVYTRTSHVVAGLLRVLLGLLLVAPFVWMVAASLKPEPAIHADVRSLRSFVPAPLTLENYAEALRRSDLSVALVNSALQVLLIALLGLLINTPAAYALARMPFAGRGLLFAVLLATIIIPIEAIVVPLFLEIRPTLGWQQLLGPRPWTLAALSLPFAAKAFNIYLIRQHFLSLPRALEEAAMLDGAGRLRTFLAVGLPHVRPALITCVLLDVVVHWNDFLWPLIVCQAETTRTVQIGLAGFFTQPPIHWGAILAYATLASVPLTLLFIGGQRWIIAGLAQAPGGGQ